MLSKAVLLLNLCAIALAMDFVPVEVKLQGKPKMGHSITTGFAQRIVYRGFDCQSPKMQDDIPLGQCVGNFMGLAGRKPQFAMHSIQTYKGTSMVDLVAQGYRDAKCRHPLGKPKHMTVDAGTCTNDYSSWQSFMYSAEQQPTPVGYGLTVMGFDNNNCNSFSGRTVTKWASNGGCVNGSITNDPNVQSFYFDCNDRYLYEYSQPNCQGYGSYWYSSWLYKCFPHGQLSISAECQGTPTAYPTYAPVPTSEPTSPQYMMLDNYANGTAWNYYYNVLRYEFYFDSVPAGYNMTGGILTLTYSGGYGAMYVTVDGSDPSYWNYQYASGEWYGPLQIDTAYDTWPLTYYCQNGCWFKIMVILEDDGPAYSLAWESLQQRPPVMP